MPLRRGLDQMAGMLDDTIPATFLQYAADILADTNRGLSGSDIVKATAAYAVEYNVNVPHPTYPFDAPNKRTALYQNLLAFSPAQQYRIIKELCDHRSFSLVPNPHRQELKLRLATRYQHLAPEDDASEINETLIQETRHWLGDYPSVLSLYNGALQNVKHDDAVIEEEIEFIFEITSSFMKHLIRLSAKE